MANLILKYKLLFDSIKAYEKYGIQKLNENEFNKYVKILRVFRRVRNKLYK